jgi:hypothetical protein
MTIKIRLEKTSNKNISQIVARKFNYNKADNHFLLKDKDYDYLVLKGAVVSKQVLNLIKKMKK